MESNGEEPEKIGKTFFEVYWSKAQMKARQHVNMIATQKAIMNMWKKDSESNRRNNGAVEGFTESVDDSVNLDQLLMYIDRMRFRKPGTGSKLTPHLDSGSISRWSDPIYRY